MAGFAVVDCVDGIEGADVVGAAGRVTFGVIEGAVGVDGTDTWGAAGIIGGGTIPAPSSMLKSPHNKIL